MIKGHCFTNLDDYQYEYFPEYFATLPNKGDMVQANSGRCLYVCNITHCYDYDKDIPYVKIELTNRR